MSSTNILYPPIINSYEPAFVAASDAELKVHFSLSSLSSLTPEQQKDLTVHASIFRKDGVKVINTVDDGSRYRAAGIILDLEIQKEPEGSYYVVLNNSDIKSQVGEYNGWIPGWTYKIQLRLSLKKYDDSERKGQARWLQENSRYFSEWSSMCYTKAISPMILQIPVFKYDSSSDNIDYLEAEDEEYTISEMNFSGSIFSSNIDANENYSTVHVWLYKDGELIEDSGEIYRTEISNTGFYYDFKTNFEEDVSYELQFSYLTENEYRLDKPLVFHFKIDTNASGVLNAYIYTIDSPMGYLLEDETTLDKEEDEGRIGLKLFSNDTTPYSGNICIRRSSMIDNFSKWEDIKIITLKGQPISDYPIVYDYTIQSGIWYKYGIQKISFTTRGKLNSMDNPVQRLFNHSYLLGQDEQQLKLSFDNTMNSFKIQVLDSKTETIGSKYPFVSRNAEVYYKTFPINGLISFWMDENNTFLKKGKLSLYSASIKNEYELFNAERNITQRDFTYEKDFRDKVLEFLSNGKPKLFKSPTEGNIIVRLTDVSCTPNQPLGRLIYSFTANAVEIAENTLDNYLKYGFFNIGSCATDFSTTTTYLGQITKKFSTRENILETIYDKYTASGANLAGYKKSINSIERILITINDPPLRVRNNNGEIVLGNNFDFNRKTITIYSPNRFYEFDSNIKIYFDNKIVTDSLYLDWEDDDREEGYIDATIDFLYTLKIEPYEGKVIERQFSHKGLGQYCHTIEPGLSIYHSIFEKYYFESDLEFRRLNFIYGVEIEADPHTVFSIQDSFDSQPELHEVGETGVLRLYDLNYVQKLKYVGKRYNKIMYDESSLSDEIIIENTTAKDAYGNDVIVDVSTDVTISYYYNVISGTYRE